VARQSCLADKRGVELVLTATGKDAIERIAKVHVQSVRDNLVDILTPEQFNAIGEAMGIVRDHLDPEGHSGR
jgi:DNA-binding MarR family transcriptional regulator